MDTLFGEAVDLKGFSNIARMVGGAKASYYTFKAEPSADELYRLVTSLSYTARLPLTDEPFTKLERVGAKRIAVARLEQNVRHFAEASVLWNFSKFVAAQAQYRHGSLPPAFKLVDHQLTLGLSWKMS